MKLQLARPEGWNVFTAYGEGYVAVNAVRYGHSVIVLPNRVIEAWTTADTESLALADFELLAALDAEIVLLGTARHSAFPAPTCSSRSCRPARESKPWITTPSAEPTTFWSAKDGKSPPH